MLRVVTLVLALTVCAVGAFAQNDADWKTCHSDDDDAAIPACTRVLKRGKLTRNDLGIVHYNRGLSYRRKDRLDDALADYNKSIEYNSKYPDAYNNRGVVYELKREFERALSDYDTAIRLNPKNANPYSNRGDVYRKQGQFEKAIVEYQAAISINPKRAVDHSDLAEAYMLTGQYELAIASASRSIGLDNDRSAAFYARGLSAFYVGDYRAAAADLRRAVDLRTQAYSIIYRYLARARAGEMSTDELQADAGRLTSTTWPYSVIEMLMGKRTPEATLSGASGASELCDAHYFGAQYHQLRDNQGEHAAGLRNAADACPSGDYEFMGVRAELARIRR